jgi:hypothetical protein
VFRREKSTNCTFRRSNWALLAPKPDHRLRQPFDEPIDPLENPRRALKPPAFHENPAKPVVEAKDRGGGVEPGDEAMLFRGERPTHWLRIGGLVRVFEGE